HRLRGREPGVDERGGLRGPARLGAGPAPAGHARPRARGLGLRPRPARRDGRALVLLGPARARREPPALLRAAPRAPEVRPRRETRRRGRASDRRRARWPGRVPPGDRVGGPPPAPADGGARAARPSPPRARPAG